MALEKALNADDVRELGWVADVLEAAANGAEPDQGYQQAALDLAGVIRSKLPDPVEVFGPGTLLRRKNGLSGDHAYLVTVDGVYCTCDGTRVAWADPSILTSENFEAVPA